MIKNSQISNPELFVVFDTSAIFNRRVSSLMSNPSASLVRNHSSHAGLSVGWYVPRTVVDERRYQMQIAALELAASAEKLDNLLEDDLKFSESKILEAVDYHIEVARKNLGLENLELDFAAVDWERLISDAVNRRPPFEEGEDEKGFRDAVILETFVQLVENHPEDKSARRFVFACQDQLLIQAANERTSSRGDVFPAAPIRDIEGTINALVSEVDEATVTKLQRFAETMFFVSGDKSTLFYKWDLPATIESKFSQELVQLPMGARRRQNWDYVVLPPRFVREAGSRITWVSQITLDHTAYTHMYPSAAGSSGGISSGLTPSLGASPLSTAGFGPTPIEISPFSSTGGYSSSLSTVGLSSFPYSTGTSGGWPQLPPISREVILSVGRTVFEVEWSTKVPGEDQISQPELGEITIVEFNWF